MFGGMTWVPSDRVTLSIPTELTPKGYITVEGLTELFSDLMDTLMPSIKVFVKVVDEKLDDF